MITLATRHQTFQLVGTASNFKLKKKNRICRFDLLTEQGIYRFKIPPKLHKKLNFELDPHTKLQVSGTIWTHPKKNKIKLEIQRIEPLASEKFDEQPQPSLGPAIAESRRLEHQGELKGQPSQEKKHKILICKKSTCWKKGGKVVYERLQEVIGQEGLEDQVCIKTAGCMGRCKKAPNLMTMPDKKKYTNFTPGTEKSLLEAIAVLT